MSKRTLGIVAAAVVVIAALVVWKLHRSGSGDGKLSDTAGNAPSSALVVAGARERVDPRKLERASIAGTIRDEEHKPIAGARVCGDASSPTLPGELVRDPRCTVSDAQGAYTLADLYAAEYSVAAMARSYLPELYHPGGDRDVADFELRAGEHKTGVDFVLVKGGAELTGLVADISGGPIAHALVRASEGSWSSGHQWPAIETDDAGKFTMWVKAGDVNATAVADGYAPGSDRGRAPGKLEILLTPESSLAGTVVDAKTSQPVPGVAVEVQAGEWSGENAGAKTDLTDDQGHFRVTRLTPGRYVAVARSPSGYGHSDGSSRVGLGQHVAGVVVKLYPAYQVSGRVVEPGDKRPTCKQSTLYLHQAVPARWLEGKRDPDGTLHVDGVLPGKYEVTAECAGFQAKDKYPPVEVKDKDVTKLEWEVDAGATVSGRVVTKSGVAVEGATIWAQSVGGAARSKTDWSGDTSQKDGTYRLKGLKQGSYKIEAETDRGVGPRDGWKIEVKATAVTQDLTLDDVGTIQGKVVDADGKPLAGVHVDARTLEGNSWNWGGSSVRSNDDGAFTLEGNRAGDYRVVASRDWSDELRKPGSNDDARQGERVTVHAGQTSSVRLVVESRSGTIKGACVDPDGKPISDAFVSVARDSDAAGNQRSSVGQTRWSWDDKPVLAGTDGTFSVTKLSPGTYTVRADRKGGGEAIAEHVAVGTSVKLVFKPTGQVDGLVHRDGGSFDELDVALQDDKTGFARGEHFFRTSGKFTLTDLPAGHFTLTASTEGGQKQTTIDLAEGEHKTGIDIELDPLVTLTGRVIELGTTKPVAGITMAASIGQSGNISMSFDDDRENVSDEGGRFTIKNAPRGTVSLFGFPKDWSDSEFGMIRTTRQIDGTGTIDLGDVVVVRRRLKPGDTAGDMGVHWVQQPQGTPLDQRRFEVSWIDPNGAAAKTDIKVGDVVTSVDGVDVGGANFVQGYSLMVAPVGTKLSLGLARGTTVVVVLASPG